MAIQINDAKKAGKGDKNLISPVSGWNADYVESLYEQWKNDPASLPDSWNYFFSGFEMAMCPRTCVAAGQADAQSRVASLIYAYRSQGHLIARYDPLGNNPSTHPDLELESFGFTDKDLTRIFDTGHLAGPKRASLGDILNIVRETYCGSIGVQYTHIENKAIRRWLQNEMESVHNRPDYSKVQKHGILERLIDSEIFEKFIQARYPGQKRFSLEGAETLIPAMHSLAELAPDLGIEEIVIGMAHRGRLNVLANILDKPYSQIFSEFEGNFIPETVGGDSDVKYHKGFRSDHVQHFGRKKSVHLSLTANPSHLEAVNPVVEGRARAKQRQRNDTEGRKKVLPLLIHGDAAFTGQGLVAETLNLSQLNGYKTGGTVHLIINNQIGFTTDPSDSRTSSYCTDIAKSIQAPIFHVNGDNPEATVFTVELALKFRQEFGMDAVVDMVCYRRHGHNESDEPRFTQPLLYQKLKDHPSVMRSYSQKLLDEGTFTVEEEAEIEENFRTRLQEHFDIAKQDQPEIQVHYADKYWKDLEKPYSDQVFDTKVKHSDLLEVTRALTTIPDGFALNPKIGRHLPVLTKTIQNKGVIDWAGGELLAYGTLLKEGVPVRLSGQDSERGTFSHRHAVWQDMVTQEKYKPLNNISDDQGKFCVYNSPLSEGAVLGFDYGYSITEPRMLVIWEAQFGDFANGAQTIIDQFITSSESKWQRSCGLVMLLPHGYEGQGPEHSNAYLERYLAACAQNNIQVCNLTTPAQYFHVIRRQIIQPFRKPLIIMSPKSLLRHKMAVSSATELIDGHFQEIIDDQTTQPEKIKRMIFSSGKIYWDLYQKRQDEGREDIALIRIEQLYPLSKKKFKPVKDRYPQVEEILWVQEETKNRGAWTYINPLLSHVFKDKTVRYVGRSYASSPATGSLRIHNAEQAFILDAAILGKSTKHDVTTLEESEFME